MCNKETAVVMSVDLKGAGDTLWRHAYFVIVDGIHFNAFWNWKDEVSIRL